MATLSVPPRLRTWYSNMPPKRRMWTNLIVGLGTLLALAAFAVSIGSTERVAMQRTANAATGLKGEPTQVTNVKVGGSSISDSEGWIASEGAKVNVLTSKVDELRSLVEAQKLELERLQRERANGAAAAAAAAANPPAAAAPQPAPAAPPRPPIVSAPTPAPAPAPRVAAPTAFPPGSPMDIGRGVGQAPADGAGAGFPGLGRIGGIVGAAAGTPAPATTPSPAPAAVEPTEAPAARPITRVTIGAAPARPPQLPGLGQAQGSGAAAGANAAGAGANATAADPESFMQVGMTQASLIGGMAATTSSQARNDPLPFFVMLTDLSLLPNNTRADYKGCIVVGSARGDKSTRRVYGRADTISCTKLDGSQTESPIEAVLYDSDGNLGLRGTLATEAVPALVAGLQAGVLSGLGQALSITGTSVTAGPLGTVTSTTGSGADALRAGVGQGVGRALDRYAQTKLREAEETSSYIQVGAGRQVTLGVLKGTALKWSQPTVAVRGQASRYADLNSFRE